MGDDLIKVDVHGINETLMALQRMERQTYNALRKELVAAAAPLAKKVGAEFPAEPPLAGWHKSGGRKGESRLPPYTGAARNRVRGVAGTGYARGRGRNLLRIQQFDPAGQILDKAGSQSVHQFTFNLDKHTRRKSRKGRTRSRIMFKVVKNNVPMIEVAVKAVIAKIDYHTGRRLTGKL